MNVMNIYYIHHLINVGNFIANNRIQRFKNGADFN